MGDITTVIESLRPMLPSFLVFVAAILAIVVFRRVFDRIRGQRIESQYPRQLLTAGLVLLAAFVFLLVLPIGDSMRAQLVGLVGILLSAALALSSTTFLGNALAGLMLRVIRNFRPGDFITVGEHCGRVSERGLFHTEIQTEDRDLTTLPNLYLVTHPVRVIRSTGTLLSATVSLGYDVPRSRVETVLLAAAQKAGLEESFVSILELGDFSVQYRLAGLLADVKELLSARSRLRSMMLDSLHEASIEIVSPSFLNARVLADTATIIPPESRRADAESPTIAPQTPDTIVFDKADQAESIEKLRQSLSSIDDAIDSLQHDAKGKSGTDKDALQRRIEQLQVRRNQLAEVISQREAKLDT